MKLKYIAALTRQLNDKLVQYSTQPFWFHDYGLYRTASDLGHDLSTYVLPAAAETDDVLHLGVSTLPITSRFKVLCIKTWNSWQLARVVPLDPGVGRESHICRIVPKDLAIHWMKLHKDAHQRYERLWTEALPLLRNAHIVDVTILARDARRLVDVACLQGFQLRWDQHMFSAETAANLGDHLASCAWDFGRIHVDDYCVTWTKLPEAPDARVVTL